MFKIVHDQRECDWRKGIFAEKKFVEKVSRYHAGDDNGDKNEDGRVD